MEKIKNLLNPGGKHDDEVLYGSGQSSDPIHSGNNTGSSQGTHLGSSRSGGHDSNPLSSNPPASTTGDSGYGNYGSTTGRSAGNDGFTGSSGLGSSSSFASGTQESRIPGAFDDDAASTTAIRSGIPGHGASGLSGTSDTNKPLPREPGSSLLGSGSNTNVGPHSSALENKLDPRVDSDLDGSRALGRSTGTTGSGLTGSSLPDRSIGNSGHDNSSSSLGRDAAIGAGVLGATGAAHHHGLPSSDPTTSSTGSQGRSFPLGGHENNTSGLASGTHNSSLANRADPRVDSDRDRSQIPGIVDTGLPGYGPQTWEHQHGPHGHQYEGDPCDHEPPVPGPHFVQGPHATDTANLLDPHVAGTVIPPGSTTGTGHGHHHGQSTTGTGISPTSMENDNQHEGHHLGRDAAIGAAGVSYGVGRDHPSSSTATATDSTSATHKPSLIDRITGKHTGTTDEPVSGGTSSLGRSEPHHTSGLDSRLESQPRSTTETGQGHHYGRDAVGVGAIGAAGYEAEKHHHHTGQGHQPSGIVATSGDTLGTRPGNTSSFGHLEDHTRTEADLEKPRHLGRDAVGVGAIGAAGYEAEKHHHNKEDIPRTSGLSGTSAGSGYGQQTGPSYGLGRDAALVGGASTALGAEKHHHGLGHPSSTTSSSAQPSAYEERDASGTHYKRDAALGAGAVGAGAVVGSEFSKKEAEKEAKQHAKEEAKHEKELEKEHKHHEKELQKEHKAHEKVHEKEDHHDKKKHGGGLFGFLHRDKSDKELKDEEAARTGTTSLGATGAGAMSGVNTGATSSFGHLEDHSRTEADLEQPTGGHHERNRLHKDPPAGFLQSSNTKYADAPQGGYASQVTGGTGTTALAEGHDYEREAGGRGVESTTGLPIDYSKGDGSYGTDNTPVPHHHHGGSTSGAAAGAMGTNEYGSTLPGESTRPGGTFDSSKVNSSYPGAPGTNDGYETGHVPHSTHGASGTGTGRY